MVTFRRYCCKVTHPADASERLSLLRGQDQKLGAKVMKAMTKKHRVFGFTLIELMIVVAIVGILSAIAVPQYQGYVQKGRRAAAQAFLLQVAQREQQYFLDNRTYAPSLTDLNVSMTSDVSPYYQIVDITTGAAPPTFRIEIKPIGSQVSNNEPNLAIDAAGIRTPTGTAYGAW